ncbi:hypothetical protein MGG_17527 [Pyricularia oryzae 70-15]|uniref:Uncharacterized protein n=3 Tax=Pyricularia oryzae TaxID=318829 RepID=G4NE90_PYRO7|nr:uncharacterized protein MGG_17527 [Pyricularia oryzae 70-15]EHA49419.1 hypothetical protein MGG_17527 [Pyricularia oryzae 70-15]ELQ42499.1 hypothetical protein OOU_Y34scaffold00206g8 [Pyricularia oryzae Y34]
MDSRFEPTDECYYREATGWAKSNTNLVGRRNSARGAPGSYGRRSLYKEGETESGKIEQPASLLYEYLYMHKRVG